MDWQRKNIFGYKDERGAELLAKSLGIPPVVSISQNDERCVLDYLSLILRRFSEIPYENATKHEFFGSKFMTPFDLALGFIRDGTGGTCFPLVWALKKILDYAGFDSFIALADRTYAPRSHCLLFVRVKEKFFIADVGFSVFKPVEVPVEDRSSVVEVPQGWLEFSWKDNRIEVNSLFPNGHSKFRYEVIPEPASESEFFGAWEETFKFEMMNHVVLVKLVKGKLVYIKDTFVHFIKDGVSRNMKFDPDEVVELAGELGVKKAVFEKALWRVLSNLRR